MQRERNFFPILFCIELISLIIAGYYVKEFLGTGFFLIYSFFVIVMAIWIESKTWKDY